MVGPAILYLPHGFAGAGWALALPIMLGATAMYLYSSQCLLQAWKHESTKWETQLQPLGGGTNRRSILSYPELANRALGPHGEWLVKIGIALMQSGVCLTYLIFVPQNLHTSMLILFGWNVSAQWWLVAMIVIQIPLSWIRDIRKLTITNFMATILILFGLSLCLGFAFDEASSSTTLDVGPFQSMWDRLTKLHPFGSTWFLFIGTSVLLFEGSITLLVPLQEAVHSEEERKRFPVVYQRVILWIIGFYAFFGTVNWMAFGDNVNVVLTTSLPSNVLATTVQLAYSVAVIFTFPLQNFPALEIACQSISNHLGLQKELRNLISSILVILLALVAVATMDSLDKVVSLMGSLLGCPIAFCFPPWIHSNLCCPTGTRWWGNRLVLGLGLIAMILASVTTIMVW
jgi:proton-coupled amino acid transporter